LTPGDVIQSELDARWAWEHLREHSERLARYVKEPPERLSGQDREVITVMARLILGAMWNTRATGDIDRLRPPLEGGDESPVDLARRLAGLLEHPPTALPDS
jgi:hypothetical protein